MCLVLHSNYFQLHHPPRVLSLQTEQLREVKKKPFKIAPGCRKQTVKIMTISQRFGRYVRHNLQTGLQARIALDDSYLHAADGQEVRVFQILRTDNLYKTRTNPSQINASSGLIVVVFFLVYSLCASFKTHTFLQHNSNYKRVTLRTTSGLAVPNTTTRTWRISKWPNSSILVKPGGSCSLHGLILPSLVTQALKTLKPMPFPEWARRGRKSRSLGQSDPRLVTSTAFNGTWIGRSRIHSRITYPTSGLPT